jgi:hypothetical protein
MMLRKIEHFQSAITCLVFLVETLWVKCEVGNAYLNTIQVILLLQIVKKEKI